MGHSPSFKNRTPGRLAPEMASFRLLVLAFVRDYIQTYAVSPSQNEIANALATTRTRVRDALRSLVKDGLLLKAAGERGLKLPSMRDEALRQLRELGWQIDPGASSIAPPGQVSTLHGPPDLDYPDRGAAGGDQNGDEGNRG